MKPLKVMTVLGTRPEIIRLSRVIPALDRAFEHVLVHTGQSYDYELNQIFFDDLELRAPDHFLAAAGETTMETVANLMVRVDDLLARSVPDALLVLGDTNSCLAAYPAKRRKIPIFHMEAGNRCFDQRVPEEINRKIVDHLADVNLPYSDIAREYLLREGLPPERVIKTGSPMLEVLTHFAPKIAKSDVVARLGLAPLDYFVVSVHREENVDGGSFAALVATLNAVAERHGKRMILSTHPRTRSRIAQDRIALHPLLETAAPFGFTDYVKLQTQAIAVLSDSGTISEESSILNFPALNLREAHERPEAMQEAAVMLTGLGPGNVLRGLEILASQPRGDHRLLRLVADYAVPNVSAKMVRLLLSHAHVVDRTVWRKPTGVG
jgi:UDP-N-acetylglucosamine 2-epimerase (non-hydrolysing)